MYFELLKLPFLPGQQDSHLVTSLSSLNIWKYSSETLNISIFTSIYEYVKLAIKLPIHHRDVKHTLILLNTCERKFFWTILKRQTVFVYHIKTWRQTQTSYEWFVQWIRIISHRHMHSRRWIFQNNHSANDEN